MPSHYAHYRFGAQVIPHLPPEAQRSVRLFRSLYDVGLHGPDIFFYHNIFFKDKVVALGSKYHNMSGEDFFTPICKRLRLAPNEAALAYLYGLLTHYCLDSTLHPFVYDKTNSGEIGHIELEAEFDRYLLQKDGKPTPNTFDCSPHMHLTDGECATVSEFYANVSPMTVKLSLGSMASVAKFTAMPNGNFRRMVEGTLKGKLRENFMGRTPNKLCAHLDEPMFALYEEAMAKFPAMAEALRAHMTHNAPLGELFESSFNI